MLGIEHEPPGPEHVVDVTCAVFGQSATVQHVELPMHELLAEHTCVPPGHEHEPPAPLHDWPLTVQSAVVQQEPVLMHVLLALHTRFPLGHAHVPPMPEHV